jgi:asparagine synthase (glutamine-hydrolysing)
VNHHIVESSRIQFGRAFLETMVGALGEPFGDTSALASWLVSEAARREVKVALSGDGGDEIFLGYTGLERQRLARRFRSVPGPARSYAVRALEGRLGIAARRLRKYIALSLEDDAGVIIEWPRRWPTSVLTSLVGPDLLRQLHPEPRRLFPEIREILADGQPMDFGERQLRFHLLVTLPCDSLFKVDRASMAHGLEVRVPLLSAEMLDFASRLPLEARRSSGRSKEPLRTVVERLSPTVRVPSPKRGFEFPLDAWMRRHAAVAWREWGLTNVLAGMGLQARTLERLVDVYEELEQSPESFESSTLARQLFDLMLLGVWVESEGITTPA